MPRPPPTFVGRLGGGWSRFLLGGPGAPAFRLFGVALGLVALKDLLWFQVYYHALDFHDRLVSPYLALPRIPLDGVGPRLCVALQTAATFSALALVAGVVPRLAALLLLACYGYSFLSDSLAYTNNLYVLLVFLAAYSLGAGPDPRARRAAGRVAQLFLASIYLVGGLTKVSSLWLSGAILHEAFFFYQGIYTAWINQDHPALFQALAWATVPAELSLAVGLWFPRTRLPVMAIGVAFHAGIELFLPVRMFSYLMVSGYLLFLDAPTLRRLDSAVSSCASSVRALAGLGAMWLLNRFFTRFTGNYAYLPHADLPLLISLPAIALLDLARLAPRPWPARSWRWPALRSALIPAWLALHAALLLKPAFGKTTDFSFRLFTELVFLRVELHVREEGQWRQIPLFGQPHGWNSTTFYYTWAGWVDARRSLEAYARWVARERRDAEAIRVEAFFYLDQGDLLSERWEITNSSHAP